MVDPIFSDDEQYWNSKIMLSRTNPSALYSMMVLYTAELRVFTSTEVFCFVFFSLSLFSYHPLFSILESV